MSFKGGSTNKNLSLMIVAVIGVSVIGGGWYLMQIQRARDLARTLN